MRAFAAGLILALVVALSGACGTTARQRRPAVTKIVVGTVTAAGVLAAIGLLYGLVACADRNHGSCSIPIGEASSDEPQLPQR